MRTSYPHNQQHSSSSRISTEMFSKESESIVEDVKLKAVYVSPLRPLSPVPEGSDEGSSPRPSMSENGSLSASDFTGPDCPDNGCLPSLQRSPVATSHSGHLAQSPWCSPVPSCSIPPRNPEIHPVPDNFAAPLLTDPSYFFGGMGCGRPPPHPLDPSLGSSTLGSLLARESEMVNVSLEHANPTSDCSLQCTPDRHSTDPEIVSGFTQTDLAHDPTVEELFRDTVVPPWTEQLTPRAFVIAFIISIVLIFVSIKSNLATGMVPNSTFMATLLGYSLTQFWMYISSIFGFPSRPFTRQENTVVMAIVVSAVEIAFTGGYGTYLPALTASVAKQASEGQNIDVWKLSLRWIYPFVFCVSFLCVPLTFIFYKPLISKLKLIFPCGTADGELINSFHIPNNQYLIRRRSWLLVITSGLSLVWSFIKWIGAKGKGCGINHFPTFGNRAYRERLFFDSSAAYIGFGMITPKAAYSLTFGAILSWTVIWPLIGAKKGKWYDASMRDSDFRGLQGYKVAIPMAMILGDLLYMIINSTYQAMKERYNKYKASTDPMAPSPTTFDNERRHSYFTKEDPIATWKAIALYIGLGIISFFLVSFVLPTFIWYRLAALIAIAPILAFLNAYGSGKTNWSLTGSYVRVVIFSVAAWDGRHGGIVMSLLGCGVTTAAMSIVSTNTQSLKVAYMTLTSLRAMMVAQIVGTLFGCLLTPIIFYLLLKAFPDIGSIGSDYPTPNALVYRLMSILGVEGWNALPQHCLLLCLIAFIGAFVISMIKDSLGKTYQKTTKFIPRPMTMAIPFFIGGSFAIDLFIGKAILYLWEWKDECSSRRYARTFASDLSWVMDCGPS